MKKFFCIFAIFSCVFAYQPEINLDAPEYIDDTPEKDFLPEFSKPGSLFGQGERPLFSDRRAMKPDDLITILIDEKSNANYSTSKTYNKNSSGSSAAPVLQYNGADAQNAQNATDLNNSNNYTLINPATNTNFKGGGTQSKNQDLKFTITARVLKVLENGNYFISGAKEILVDGEKQIIRISGVARPFDVQKDNTIESKFLADSKILFTNIGDLSNTNRKKPASDAVQSEFPY